MAHAETPRGPAWSRPSDLRDGHTPPSPAPSRRRTLRAMELEGDTIQGEQEQEDWSEGEAEEGGAMAEGEAAAELAALRLVFAVRPRARAANIHNLINRSLRCIGDADRPCHFSLFVRSAARVTTLFGGDVHCQRVTESFVFHISIEIF